MSKNHLLPRVYKEISALVLLGLPIIISQVAQTAMGFVDTLMAGNYSEQALAAVAIGSSLWIPALLTMNGVLMALTPILSQAFGANDQQEIQTNVEQGYWAALFFGVGFAILLYQCGPIFELAKAEPDVVTQATGYIKAIAWGLPAMALFQVVRSLNEGFHQTRPIMVIGLLGLGLNIPLNYLLIYGATWQGQEMIPAMGAIGCGIATTIVMWVSCLLLTLVSLKNSILKPAKLLQHFVKPHWQTIRTILTIGLPIGLSIFVEVSMFSFIALFIAEQGASVVAGHQATLSFTSMTFMVPLSLSMAITIRAGHAIGQGESERARFICYAGIALTLSLALVSSSAMILLPDHIASIYSDNATVLQITASLLILAGIFQFSDALQVSANGGLRAYKDTRWPFVIIMISYWGVGIPLGYLLGATDYPSLWANQLDWHWLHSAINYTSGDTHFGPSGFWFAMVVGLTIAAVLLNIRLYKVSRRAIH